MSPFGKVPDVREGEERLRVEDLGGDPTTLALVGEVDPHTAPQLAEALEGLVGNGATTVRIDASRLDFIDSSGLRVLVEAHRAMGAGKEALVVAGASPTFRRLLEVTGLDEHVTVEP